MTRKRRSFLGLSVVWALGAGAFSGFPSLPCAVGGAITGCATSCARTGGATTTQATMLRTQHVSNLHKPLVIIGFWYSTLSASDNLIHRQREKMHDFAANFRTANVSYAALIGQFSRNQTGAC